MKGDIDLTLTPRHDVLWLWDRENQSYWIVCRWFLDDFFSPFFYLRHFWRLSHLIIILTSSLIPAFPRAKSQRMASTEKNKNPIISVFCHRYLCLLKAFSILSVSNVRFSHVWNGTIWLVSKNGEYREKQESNYISVLPLVLVFIKSILIFFLSDMSIRCLKWYSMTNLQEWWLQRKTRTLLYQCFATGICVY
jgi:hypothetical protein